MRDSEYIDRLGRYFVHFSILPRFNITFEQFVNMVERGDWALFIADERGNEREATIGTRVRNAAISGLPQDLETEMV